MSDLGKMLRDCAAAVDDVTGEIKQLKTTLRRRRHVVPAEKVRPRPDADGWVDVGGGNYIREPR